ncbi:hypothetical protein [Clostridium sp.]|uniref:hypothetical protein n=1 Tax=Clostridium sp. TaxID=1506 RepID=UPI00290788DE|nr:hypothetical protein [Clostridium sp.]MDU3323339.1 hypothetical protein [Escherichia coli]MDU3411742.1 hypothetical protein [Clostridium sp.]
MGYVKSKEILSNLKEGTKIHKSTKGETVILGVNEDGFEYSIGTKNSKFVTLEELEWALEKLKSEHCFTRKQYDEKFPIISKSNPCNFTSIGGLLVTLNYASYSRGKYEEVK